MSKLTFKNMSRLMFVLLIFGSVYILYVYKINSGKRVSETNIFEIKDTQSIYYLDGQVVKIEKNYMISKPPEEPYKLRTLVDNYSKHILVNFENVKNEVRKARNEADTEINKIIVCINFYRESSRLPTSWKPNEAYFNTDRIEHHKDDCIASILWSDLNPQKSYTIIKRSSRKADYGEIYEIFEYNDDQLIQHQVYKISLK